MTNFKLFNMHERNRCLRLCISMVELSEQPITSIHQATANRAAIRSMRASIKLCVRRLKKNKGINDQFLMKVSAAMWRTSVSLVTLGRYISAHPFETDDRWWLP